MGPSNKMKQGKTKAAKHPQPLANTIPLDSNNHTASPSNDISSPASATRVAFRHFIEIAELGNIKLFLETAASTSDSENLRLLWARAFKEGLMAGHQLYGKTVERLNEAHNKGYEEGYGEGRRDEEIDWRCEGHSGFCSHLQVHQDSSTQTEPPAFVDASASTADEYTTVSEPTPTQIDPPPPVPTVTVDSSTQTQDDADDSPPLPPISSISTVERDPPPETKSRSPPLPPSTSFDWANDAATSLPILPSNPPPRDLSCLRSPSPRLFSSLQRRNKKLKKQIFRPFNNFNLPSVHCQNNFHTRSLPPYASSAPFVPKPGRSPSSALNWEGDPRLSDLSRALKALGWIRPPAVRAPPW